MRDAFARITFPKHDPANPVNGLGKPDVTFYDVDPAGVDERSWGQVTYERTDTDE